MDAAARRRDSLSTSGHTAPERWSATYARRLLTELGIEPQRPVETVAEHPALGWARCGLMALTGRPDGDPLLCPVPITACADGALAALASLAPAGAFEGLRGSRLLAERAAIAGFTRNGLASVGGACRLVEAADGWFALNLPRDDDWALLPAWLEAEVGNDWPAVQAAVRERNRSELVERAHLLGLAAAAEGAVSAAPTPWRDAVVAAATTAADAVVESVAARVHRERPLVVDLSALWAGPLCGHLLQLMGADVVKFESEMRPDGARFGPPEFFDLLNANKRSAALDTTTDEGRAQLRTLLAHADIVIEGSRPRGLAQLGIDAAALVREHPGLTWVSITGYGRDEPRDNWVAYGDDAGIAAGLSRIMAEATGERVFVGDAIADPLSGMHAALVAWAGYLAGGGGLISIALHDVVRHCIEFDCPTTAAGLRQRMKKWSALIAGEPVAAPQARAPARIARALGADTSAVLAELPDA